VEEAIKKSGVELFREMLRLYPVAELEDYYKGRLWKDDLMRADLQLIAAHRREAGAPDPIPLEEVPMPELPKQLGMTLPGLGVRPIVPGGVTLAAGALGTRAVTPTGASSTGPLAELRLIALFVAKWKLDPTRTKMMLAKMTPQRRRYIIQSFKPAPGSDTTEALLKYMAECEKNNSWGPSPAAGATATVKPPGIVATGVKRPLVASGLALDASKRPRINPPTVTPAKAGIAAGFPRPVQSTPTYRPVSNFAAARAPTTVRPAGVVRPGFPAVRPGGVTLGRTAVTPVRLGMTGMRPGMAARPGFVRPNTGMIRAVRPGNLWQK